MSKPVYSTSSQPIMGRLGSELNGMYAIVRTEVREVTETVAYCKSVFDAEEAVRALNNPVKS